MKRIGRFDVNSYNLFLILLLLLSTSNELERFSTSKNYKNKDRNCKKYKKC